MHASFRKAFNIATKARARSIGNLQTLKIGLTFATCLAFHSNWGQTQRENVVIKNICC